MENISQMSLLEVAVRLMEQKRGVQNIKSLIKEVLEMKGLTDEDGEYTSQLYIDITTSSKFVYMGNDEWDLKSRQSLDEYDKDGSAFNSKGDEYEDEEPDTLDEEDLETEDEEELEEDEEEEIDEYEDEDELDEEDSYSDSDEDDELNDGEDMERYTEEGFNEDKYNDYMDDYEDMYDEN